MSYIPPHARNAKASKKEVKKEVKDFKKEFPQLAPIAPMEKPKLDFSKLFKNIENARQARIKKMRWGMIKLTKNGIVDSLTPEERQEEETNRNERLANWNLINEVHRIEKDDLERMDRDPDWEPYHIETSSSEEEIHSEESESTEAEDPEEDEL